jgi:hypothetical protein
MKSSKQPEKQQDLEIAAEFEEEEEPENGFSDSRPVVIDDRVNWYTIPNEEDEEDEA